MRSFLKTLGIAVILIPIGIIGSATENPGSGSPLKSEPLVYDRSVSDPSLYEAPPPTVADNDKVHAYPSQTSPFLKRPLKKGVPYHFDLERFVDPNPGKVKLLADLDITEILLPGTVNDGAIKSRHLTKGIEFDVSVADVPADSMCLARIAASILQVGCDKLGVGGYNPKFRDARIEIIKEPHPAEVWFRIAGPSGKTIGWR